MNGNSVIDLMKTWKQFKRKGVVLMRKTFFNHCEQKSLFIKINNFTLKKLKTSSMN
jgi:hypothetical protein